MSQYSARGAAWQAQRRRVLERDGYVCAYCGNWLEDNHADPTHKATVDHIEPVALQSGHDYQDHELVSACLRCNGQKQDRRLVRSVYWNRRWLPDGLPG